MLAVVGLQGVFLGCLAKIFFDYTGRRTGRIMPWFRYTRAAFVVARRSSWSASVWSCRSSCATSRTTCRCPSSSVTNHLAVTGLFLMVAGFSMFVFTLLIHARGDRHRAGRYP